MTTHNVAPSLARMLTFALDNEMPEKIEGWKAKLAEGEVTDEMIGTFHGFGWLSSKHDPRITDAVPEMEPVPEPTIVSPRRRGAPEREAAALPTDGLDQAEH